jgi:hypothetical protein
MSTTGSPIPKTTSPNERARERRRSQCTYIFVWWAANRTFRNLDKACEPVAELPVAADPALERVEFATL